VPEYAKDVMIALLGASVALAGLLLVVSGFVFAQANSFPSETTDDAMLEKMETAAKLGLFPFVLALIDAALCLVWLMHNSACTYLISEYGFFLLLLMTAAYGAVLLLRFL
jgi:hypothetical protein